MNRHALALALALALAGCQQLRRDRLHSVQCYADGTAVARYGNFGDATPERTEPIPASTAAALARDPFTRAACTVAANRAAARQ
jgi:hypothetical protein